MFCVLDIESSGGPFGKEAMIEIAAFRYDGEEVVDQLISLIHPHRNVQPYVAKMTGISKKMLARAPRFHEIAKRLIEITEDAVIVGHNVSFDYRMLRQEFARLGYTYERKTLDTISLAEELIPGLKSYGLDTVCEELGLDRLNKHRAESDARATLQLFQILMEKDRRKGISSFESSINEDDYYSDKLADLRRSIKHNRGLFYLYDRHGKLLYLGASDNIKAALNRLFLGESANLQALKEECHTLKVEPAGNWLVARIKRQEELEAAKPVYHRTEKTEFKQGLYADKRQKPPQLQLLDLSEAGRKKPLFKVLNRKSGERALRLYHRNKPSVKEQIISLLLNFSEEQFFVGKGRQSSERCLFWVSEGVLQGYLYFKLNDQVDHLKEVRNNLVNIKPDPNYLAWLKLGVLSGEFRLLK